MPYIIVANFKSKTSQCACLQISEELDVVGSFGVLTLDNLGKFTIQNNLTPLNFSVDRNGAVKQDWGSFSRFGQGVVGIAIAEIVDRITHKTVGYRVVSSQTPAARNLRIDDILNKEKQYGRPFLQNMMVRGGAVTNYPMKKLPIYTTNSNRAKRSHQPEVKDRPISVEKPKRVEENKVYTDAQLVEISNARKNGVDVALISNPDLQPEQMRVLWASKKNGALAEYYSNPKFSTDAMKFYADVLYNKDTVNKFRYTLKKPELTVPQLQAIYACIIANVDYRDLVNLSAAEIDVERIKREQNFWNSEETQMTEQEIEDFDYSLFSKIEKYVRKIKG